jgi:hypothetical protein
MTKRIERTQLNSCIDTASWLTLRWDLLRLAGLLVRPYTRPAPASQAREPDSPPGLRPLPHPCGNKPRTHRP